VAIACAGSSKASEKNMWESGVFRIRHRIKDSFPWRQEVGFDAVRQSGISLGL
jgi:hypothetical protein